VIDLLAGELNLLGRVMPASNHTFLARLDLPSAGSGEEGPQVIYKPVAGERPLWDFADGSLADREYAARLVSESLGWDVVPPTVLRDGPHGRGMVQLWCEPDQDQDPVDVVPAGAVPPGMLHVLDAVGAADEPVSLVHEDSPALRRMAVFDAIVNNTDRKGGHVLPMHDGHRFGVDHGVCFHTDDKLRTVLWGWSGEPLSDEELAGVARVADDRDLAAALAEHLTVREIDAVHRRCARLLRTRAFPVAGGGWPSIPWPPF
jgi:uncharacterized repeat protein (TIGR03843 family)